MRVGIDVTELKDIPNDDKFLNRIANKSEVEYIKNFKCEKGQHQRIASLWSVKEAVMKCLGLGKDSKVTMKEIEVCHEESGRPYVKLSKVAAKAYKELKFTEIEISISHSENIVTAIAIAK